MDMKYPIGTFQFDDEITSGVISSWINEIEDLPILLRNTVKNLDNEQLDTAYRSGGWTVRQVIHHLADSHMNAYIRFKLALTEEKPVIKPYDETKWAELSDYKLPIEPSILLLETLHKRWTYLLRSLTPSDLEKTFIHPDSGEVSIGKNIECMHGTVSIILPILLLCVIVTVGKMIYNSYKINLYSLPDESLITLQNPQMKLNQHLWVSCFCKVSN